MHINNDLLPLSMLSTPISSEGTNSMVLIGVTANIEFGATSSLLFVDDINEFVDVGDDVDWIVDITEWSEVDIGGDDDIRWSVNDTR